MAPICFVPEAFYVGVFLLFSAVAALTAVIRFQDQKKHFAWGFHIKKIPTMLVTSSLARLLRILSGIVNVEVEACVNELLRRIGNH